ncbi:C-type lectin domain family 4 member E-like [Pectinophora gossypiella]|uniref:C-type lectin domain family 4 member E-like n=1 Tax=Pectinophora gossypiella TaxID=13191 RepID=UPI00214E8B9D|nr:C-type lectin domain family 4 member E-like [Pectinophora gossypiella]
MQSLLQYFLLVFIFPLFEAGRFRCDYTYFAHGTGWYKLHTDMKTWSEARHTCNGEGAHLANPINQGITDTMLSLISGDRNLVGIHIGDQTTETTEKFAQEEETYVLFRNGTYREVSSQDLYPFICHKLAGASVDLNECDTTDSQYALDNRTSKCYKFHKFYRDFYQATQTCHQEGSHLVIINSEMEAQVIRDLFSRNPADTIPGQKDFRGVAFVGIVYNNGQWTTTDGQPLSEAGYSEFSPGEPNNAAGDEYCASVNRRGKLLDEPCRRALPYICEKDPDVCYNQTPRVKPLS